jgi:ankyrin repeat protein
MSLVSIPTELVWLIGDHLKDDHDSHCLRYHGELRYGDFNSLLQVSRELYNCLNPILWKEAAECPRNTTGRVFKHLILTSNLPAVEKFLKLGADIEACLPGFGTRNPNDDSTIDVFTPILAAAYLDNGNLARLLLEHGAKAQYSQNYDDGEVPYYCAMHAARSAYVAELLWEYGANVEVEDSEKWTPLHWFARRGNVEAMVSVLLHDADVDRLGGEWEYDTDGWGTGALAVVGGRTPLHEAAQRGHVDAATILLQFGADVWVQDQTLSTAFHLAVKAEKTAVVRLLLEWCPDIMTTRNNEDKTPFHLAAVTGNLELMWLLVECWPEGVQEKDQNDNTPLHLAARCQHTELVKLLAQVWPEGTMAKNENRDTPLHVAAAWGDAEMVGVLVQLWPDAKAKRNNDGRTPLAVFAERLGELAGLGPHRQACAQRMIGQTSARKIANLL